MIGMDARASRKVDGNWQVRDSAEPLEFPHEKDFDRVPGLIRMGVHKQHLILLALMVSILPLH